MRFTKMHGAGNDYVYVDCFEQSAPADPDQLAVKISDRHFGVGGDGLILIEPSKVADARMRMFNADGSEAEIETKAGILAIDLEVEDGKVNRARVDMGEPILAPADIPTTFDGESVVDREVTIGGKTFTVTCVSMGNPHCVVFVDDPTDDWVLGVGPQVETDPLFPARTNVEFVQVISPSEVRQRTFERGSGETLACGTGASAVCVAGVLTGRTERKILNHLLGGDLELEWNEEDNRVYMTGPAVEVFSGNWPG